MLVSSNLTCRIVFLVLVSVQGLICDDLARELETSNAGAFEGDIEFGDSFRNAVKYEFQTWPGGMVPYDLGNEYDQESQKNIRKAMDKIEDETAIEGIPCIVFWPKMGIETDWIKFKNDRGCSTTVGRAGNGEQYSYLAPKCAKHFGVTMHELVHALGFWHEQNRSDRDKYVEIKWDNIKPERMWNFRQLEAESSDNLGTEYDYDSLMHYGPDYFKKDGAGPTIVPKKSGVTIGQRTHLSKIDIDRIRKLYKCTGIERKTVTKAPKQLPRISKPSNFKKSCDFEKNTCGFAEMSSDLKIKWTRTQAKSGTGPKNDHTTGSANGWSMVMDGTQAPDAGTWTRMMLHDIPESNNGYCLTYWYNVKGNETGFIRTFVSNTEYGYRRVAEDIADKSGKWKKFTWHFGASVKLRLSIDVLLFGAGTPQTAIDDLDLKPGKC
ncbi:zinc metalloproteinase nas-6-like [Tubulanus polymorphus]|uniref:zinc metalloproteinase nas-6-like n=1 Tax=Tubulanus polymorphus TaxID=672921 RepID=UPI003DA4F175